MILYASGRKRVSKFSRLIFQSLYRLRDSLLPIVKIRHNGRSYKYKCLTFHSFRRAKTLLIKEQGTIEWLEKNLQPGDIFLDVGANIGLYTIFAAELVGKQGRVYAVEPHIMNASGLIENIIVNNLGGRVIPMTMALSDGLSSDTFFYDEWVAGSTNSQFGQAAVNELEEFKPTGQEVKVSTSVDLLIESGQMLVPDMIKIDVDGLEPRIVKGMQSLLMSTHRPRSVQVETSPHFHQEVVELMNSFHYQLESCHFTMAGKKQLKRGVQAQDIPCNAIFAPLSV